MALKTWQYEKDGTLVAEHKTQSEAARAVSVTQPAICYAARPYVGEGTGYACAGYYWSVDPRLAEQTQAQRAKEFARRPDSNTNMKVAKVCPDTYTVLDTFDSQREAGRVTGIKAQAIGVAINRKNKQGNPYKAGGFYWEKVL